MGNTFSTSDKCQVYKQKILDLNQELNEYKSGRMISINSGDPYNEYSGGKSKRNKKNKKNTRRKIRN